MTSICVDFKEWVIFICPLIPFFIEASAHLLVAGFRLTNTYISQVLLKTCHYVSCFPVTKYQREFKWKVTYYSQCIGMGIILSHGMWYSSLSLLIVQQQLCCEQQLQLCNLVCCFFCQRKEFTFHLDHRGLSRVLPDTQTSSRTRSIAAGVSLTLHPD